MLIHKRKYKVIILLIFLLTILLISLNLYNKKNSQSNNLVLMSTFNGQYGEALELYYSINGEKFNLIKSFGYYKPSFSYLRDPSTIYKDGYFYVAYTTGIAGNIFGISKTKDFENWKEYQIILPGKWKKTWAPEWFINGNDVYILLSLSDGKTQYDKDNQNILFFEQYYIKADKNSLTKFTKPQKMNFSNPSNKIDGYIIKEDNIYHYFVKNEYSKSIEHYTTKSINNNWTLKQEIKFPVDVEGPSVTKINDTYFLYVDGFNTYTSLYSTSKDLETWTSPNTIKNNSNFRTQHFSTIYLPSNTEANERITDLINNK